MSNVLTKSDQITVVLLVIHFKAISKQLSCILYKPLFSRTVIFAFFD